MTPLIALRVIALSGVVAAAALTIGQGGAQMATANGQPGFSGSTPSSVAGCPYIVWRLARNPDGRINGIAYYSDLSGLSSVTGERDANGNFSLDVTPSSIGAGPSGKVSGKTLRHGAIEAQMIGQGCANMRATINPMANLNSIRPGGGG